MHPHKILVIAMALMGLAAHVMRDRAGLLTTVQAGRHTADPAVPAILALEGPDTAAQVGRLTADPAVPTMMDPVDQATEDRADRLTTGLAGSATQVRADPVTAAQVETDEVAQRCATRRSSLIDGVAPNQPL